MENNDKIPRLFDMEVMALHVAFIHAGYTVDFVFVDDEMVADGVLTTNRYTAMYLTAPNVTDTAFLQIAAWVNRGGGWQ